MNMTAPHILDAEKNGMPTIGPETMQPEPKRIQCAHCNGYYDENEICRKNLCYKCEEHLDDYQRILSQRNMFLWTIGAIKTTANLEVIHVICDGILGHYKEEA